MKNDGFCQCGCGTKTHLYLVNNAGKGHVKGMPMKCLPGHHPRGKFHHNWKGGRIVSGNSHPRIYNPDHPRSGKRNDVFEHIVFAENALGHSLPPNAVVHHHTVDQLVICEDQGYHRLLHRRTRALAESGHASWRKCVHCHKWDSPDNLQVYGSVARHRLCYNKYMRDRKKMIRMSKRAPK